MALLDRALSLPGRKTSMKLHINTTGVSFTCTRAPEQRVSFDTRFRTPEAHSNGNEHNLDDAGPDGSNR
jgi:hypothetical protein